MSTITSPIAANYIRFIIRRKRQPHLEFTHFPKPAKRFVEECIYGIQASGDTKLSSIVRAIDDDIRPIYTEKRLSRNLDDDTLEQAVAGAVLKDGARSVRGDTLLPGFADLFDMDDG